MKGRKNKVYANEQEKTLIMTINYRRLRIAKQSLLLTFSKGSKETFFYKRLQIVSL